MQVGLLTHLVFVHGEAAALWNVVSAVLAAEQAKGQRTPNRGPQPVLAVQWQVVALHLQTHVTEAVQHALCMIRSLSMAEHRGQCQMN